MATKGTTKKATTKTKATKPDKPLNPKLAGKVSDPLGLKPAEAWPFPGNLEPKVSLPTQQHATPQYCHTQFNVDWRVSIDAKPNQGWYQCLCRNEATGAIGYMVMFYDSFRAEFLRPCGTDGPDDMTVIAYTPVPNEHFVNKLLDSFDRLMEA